MLTAFVGASTLSGAQAAVSLDRTRAVFDGGEKSMTMKVSNDNKQLPFLAQAWLEDEQGKKITTGPLVVTPPVQRMEPSAKSMVRVTSTPDISKLPQDRETLFYFNLREIPPKSDKPNSMQIALQTKIKLFYRPEAIKVKNKEVWQEKLVLTPVSGGYRLQNPTPYYIIIAGMGGSEALAKEKTGFTAVTLAPKSEQTVKAPPSGTPYLTYINDYGGRLVLAFQCSGGQCTVSKK
ncbi:fimbria/pilus periplasmic chaperone [Enterobacter mori]|uniref:fimbria/pilus periplasmic chaperone n=1 Tax=Enterobacter mori TaxID=539813 RepID=UPI003B83D5B4